MKLRDDIEGVYEGAIIEATEGKRKVLGVCGKVVFVSLLDKFDNYSFGCTLANLKTDGYKLVLPENESDENRKDENSKAIKAIEDSIKHHKENLEVLKKGKEFIPSSESFSYCVDDTRVSFSAKDCALCVGYYATPSNCNECPLHKYQGSVCTGSTVWSGLNRATSLYEAVLAEENMIEVLEKVLGIEKEIEKSLCEDTLFLKYKGYQECEHQEEEKESER